MDWENNWEKISPISPLIDTRLLNASEFIDSQTNKKMIVVERGQYDSELRAYEELKRRGFPLFDKDYDQDTITYYIPPGTETIKSYIPKIIENIEKEYAPNGSSELFLPFYELGKLLRHMSDYGVKFQRGSNILEKIAISPDYSGRYGLQNFLIPPLNVSFGPKNFTDLDNCFSELRGLRLRRVDHDYLVNSLMSGFMDQYGQASSE
jgi:hypothetical protein